MLKNLKLPQNLEELLYIANKNSLVEQAHLNWSGAVVFLLVEGSLVLIKRSESMPTHAGQISFMGGHKKEGETTPFQTAAREFCEESGFVGKEIECLGLISPVSTAHGKKIIPVVARFLGTKSEFLKSVTSNGEWDDLVLAPLSFLSDATNWSHGNILGQHDTKVYFCSLLYEKCKYLSKVPNDPYILWGATAKMILNLFQNHVHSDSKN